MKNRHNLKSTNVIKAFTPIHYYHSCAIPLITAAFANNVSIWHFFFCQFSAPFPVMPIPFTISHQQKPRTLRRSRHRVVCARVPTGSKAFLNFDTQNNWSRLKTFVWFQAYMSMGSNEQKWSQNKQQHCFVNVRWLMIGACAEQKEFHAFLALVKIKK